MTTVTTKPKLRAATWTTAAMAAAASSAQAELVQIDLIDNQITASGGNQLFADLDGGGDDITISGTRAWNNETRTYATSSLNYISNGAQAKIDEQFHWAKTTGSASDPDLATFSAVNLFPSSFGIKSLSTINLSGVAGTSWLQIERRVSGVGIGTGVGDPNAGLYLSRVIYDTDPGGSGGTPDVNTQYPVVATVDKDGVITPSGEDIEVTTFSVSGGTATITIKGEANTAYTCKSSTTLTGFTEIIPTSGLTTTDDNGDGTGTATFEVAAGDAKRFYQIEK